MRKRYVRQPFRERIDICEVFCTNPNNYIFTHSFNYIVKLLDLQTASESHLVHIIFYFPTNSLVPTLKPEHLRLHKKFEL